MASFFSGLWERMTGAVDEELNVLVLPKTAEEREAVRLFDAEELEAIRSHFKEVHQRQQAAGVRAGGATGR